MLSFTTLAVTLEEADAYATARAWANWIGTDDAKTAALRRGQDFIASAYNSRWIDEWDNDHAPEEVKFSIIEAARRELVKPGSMSPDLKRGGKIKAVGAGSARVEFADGAPAETTFSIIDGLLAGLVAPKSGTLVGFAARA
ncbi:DnaT-like ssDNA-binding protein [Shinella pollutisoli]|uniref:DnaT-like ssDNA-binding protein n=1 Tax=Shinella pollutisoli TaxID=2250594 RepID=A0ABV7DDL0_9HYPH|nr:DnaT-like ssDNA-binding protein [Shinella pollutisoli]